MGTYDHMIRRRIFPRTLRHKGCTHVFKLLVVEDALGTALDVDLVASF
jgi:hypothetical protein